MKKLLKMNLQLFADGDGTGDVGGDTNTDGTQDNIGKAAADAENKADEAQKKSVEYFKAFKSEKEFQAVLDANAQKAIKTHDEKKASEAKQQKDYDKMTDLEKAQYDKEQLQKQLAESQTHAKVVENRAKITERLGSDDLPTGLISVFGEGVLSDDDALEEAYKNVSKVFADSLQTAIDKRIAASSTSVPGSTNAAKKSEGATVAEQFNKQQQPIKTNFWATK